MQTLYTRLQRLHAAHLESWLGIPTCTSREVPDLRLSHQPTCIFVTLANHEQAGASSHGATKLRMRTRLLSSELNG